MRLTSVLYQVNYHRHIQRVWKRQGKMQIQELGIPPALQEMGVEIKDATDILLETKLFKPVEQKPNPIVIPSAFHREKYFYLMHSKTKMTESQNQALALTKTVAYQGLPDEINSLIDVEKIPNQDDLVQANILQALVWNSAQHKLPKRIDVTRPGFKFRREYGIRYKHKVSGLLEKFSYLCDSILGKYAGSIARNKILDTVSEISVNRCGDNVTFQLPCDILMTSDKPLKNIASPTQVANTEAEIVPNIYPIKPTLDLDKFKEKPIKYNEVFTNCHGDKLHTLFIGQKSFGYWFPHQMLSRAIATCFAFTAAEAQRQYGVNIGKLPEPVCVQCMYLDVKSFNFLVYQLNTLDLSNNDGVKNQVWVDESSDLYDSVCEEKLLTNYNASIFPKMLAFHLNGLLPVNI